MWAMNKAFEGTIKAPDIAIGAMSLGGGCCDTLQIRSVTRLFSGDG